MTKWAALRQRWRDVSIAQLAGLTVVAWATAMLLAALFGNWGAYPGLVVTAFMFSELRSRHLSAVFAERATRPTPEHKKVRRSRP